jgi:NADPH2:quinone reductase
MRAVKVTRFGGPDVLEVREVPAPAAAAGHAVIKVAVADVLNLDAKIRSGWGREYFPIEPPYIPGNGVAGEVISTGPGVSPQWTGQRVVARTGSHGGSGGYAEQVAVPVDRLHAVPDGLGLAEAAAVLHDGSTALGIAEQAAIKPGEWVLVTAAGGGMGLLLVQLARAAGAHVIGAARGAWKLDLAQRLGAGPVVDYSGPDWVSQVAAAAGGDGVDVVLDGVGGEIGTAAFSVIADGGRFSAHGAAAGGFAEIDEQVAARRRVTVRGISSVQFSPADSRRLTGQALAAAADGSIRPVIGQTYPLVHAQQAHAALESRAVLGKTLLLT